MSFEQKRFNSTDVNLKDKAAEANPELSLLGQSGGANSIGHDRFRNDCTAEQHLPPLSLHYGGGDGAQSNAGGNPNSEATVSAGGTNSTPMESVANQPAAGQQSSEVGIGNVAQSTASGGAAGESNLLQGISSTLQTDLTNVENAINQFATDLSSAANSLGLGSDTQSQSASGTDNSAASAGSTAVSADSGPSFSQQLQSLMNYLGINSGKNSSPESTTGTPASGADTASLTSTSPNAAGDATPAITNPASESTQPTTSSSNTSVPVSAPSTSDATSTYNSATDPVYSALQAQNPEAAQILSAVQPSMTASGYSNFESALSQSVNGGQYTDVASAASAAALSLQQSGDASDSAIAVTAINNVINQNGDATINGATVSPTDNTPPAATDTTAPATAATDTTAPATAATDTTAPAPAATSTDTNPAGTSTTNTTTSGSGDAYTSGVYSVQNGQIVAPDGSKFVGKGVAVYASQAAQEAQAIFQAQPNLNIIRLAATPATDTPDDVQNGINALQSAAKAAGNNNVVVAVEDVTSPGTDGTTNNTLDGSALTAEEQWYAQIAANNVNNPNVIFGTANEPNDPGNEQNVVNQEVGIYNAIRGAGNNNLVMMEADGGGSAGPMQADTSAYAAMNNVAWDIHAYGWQSGYSTDPTANATALNNEIAGFSGITESDGNGGQQAIPFIIGEYGNSTNGQTIDANATQSVDSVQNALNSGQVQGAIAWTWNGNNEPNNSDSITSDGTLNTITNYGQEVINFNNSGAVGSFD